MTPAERLAVDLDRLDPEQRRFALDVIAQLAREARARSSADRALADLLDQTTTTQKGTQNEPPADPDQTTTRRDRR